MFLKLSRTGVKLHFIDNYFFGMKLTASKRHDKLSNWYRTDEPQKLRKRTEWREDIQRQQTAQPGAFLYRSFVQQSNKGSRRKREEMFKLAVRQSVERRSKSLLVNMNSSPTGVSWFVVRRSQSSLFLSLRMLSLLSYNSVSVLGVHYAIFQPLATVIISTNTLTSLEKVSIPSIFGRLAAVRGRYASRRIYWSRKWCT